MGGPFHGIPRSRAAAREQKSKHYFTGQPCPKGHVAPRFTAGMACVECMRIKSRERSILRRGAPRVAEKPRTERQILRRAASVAMQKTYDPGVPCIRGHVAERLTSSDSCLECERLRKSVGGQQEQSAGLGHLLSDWTPVLVRWERRA